MWTTPSELFSLDGKTALLTGAAGHLGRAMAGALAGAGARVLLSGRRAGPLEALAEEVRGAGGDASSLPFDVTDERALDKAIDQVKADGAGLHILVNNAYGGTAGKFSTRTKDDYLAAYDVAVASAAALINRAAPLLEASASAQDPASIINVASMYAVVSPDPRIYGDTGHDNPPSYGAAKAALLQYTRYAATNLAAANIRANALSPGAFPPSRVAETMPDLWKTLERKQPLGRIGRPTDLQGAVVFLASNASAYMTGANLVIDGGWTAW